MGTEARLRQVVREAVARLSPAVVLVSELGRYSLMSEDLHGTARRLSDELGVPCIAATAETLDRDFTHAFDSLMRGLARPSSIGHPSRSSRGPSA